jgi:predicted nucleic acid-binding protein
LTEHTIVCDTTVLLYLGRIGQASLLSALFERVYVPEAVLLELDTGRLIRRDTIDPRSLDWVEAVPVSQAEIDRLPPNQLGRGERAVIAYANAHRICTVGLDDIRARRLAQEIELDVIGTLGVLLRAKRSTLIPAVRPLLNKIIAEGFRLSTDLYQDVLEIAGESTRS